MQVKNQPRILFYDIDEFYALQINPNGSCQITSFHKRNFGNKLSQWFTKDGYIRTKLHSKTRTIHSIVAECYHGPRPKGFVINHRDGLKTNNHPDNLEYCTPAYNIAHAIAAGFHVSNDPKRSGRYKHGRAIKENLNAYKLEWYRANKK